MLQFQDLLAQGITKEQILQSAYNTPRKAFIRIRLYNTCPKLATVPALQSLQEHKLLKNHENVTNSIVDYKLDSSEKTGNRRTDMITDLLYLEDLEIALDNPDYKISFETPQSEEPTYTIRTRA